MVTIGVLALQGSFLMHRRSLERCGVAVREIRKTADLVDLDGLVIPGGESTTMENLAKRYGLFERIRQLGRDGLPIFGTCAGAILLGRCAEGRGDERPERWGIANVEVERNAYGTQVDSFSANLRLTPFEEPFRGVFIRAPKLVLPRGARDVEVLGTHAGDPVLVRAGRCLLATFHPELTVDLRVHLWFLGSCVPQSGESTVPESSRPPSGASSHAS